MIINLYMIKDVDFLEYHVTKYFGVQFLQGSFATTSIFHIYKILFSEENVTVTDLQHQLHKTG